MKKKSNWLSRISLSALTIFSMYVSADTGEHVKLEINFDKYYLPYVTFIVNGHPVYALVDTGSSFGLHLQESQLKKINGLKKERVYRSIDANGKVQNNIEYLADTLYVNGVKLENVTITPFKEWGLMRSGEGDLAENGPVEGPVAGLGLFKNKTILLDYVSNSLTISDEIDNISLTKDGFKEYFFQMSPDGLVFYVEQSGKKYHLLLDTGSNLSVVWSERMKSHKIISCLLVDPDMNNKECEATPLEIKSREGHSERFIAVVVAGNFKHMGEVDGMIGNNFLKNRKVLIDFVNHKVFISNVKEK